MQKNLPLFLTTTKQKWQHHVPCCRRRATALTRPTSPPPLAAAAVPTQTMPPWGTFFFFHFFTVNCTVQLFFSYVFLFLVSTFISSCSLFSFFRLFECLFPFLLSTFFSPLLIFFLCLFFSFPLCCPSCLSPFLSYFSLPPFLNYSVSSLHIFTF
jgi:hypothetical protein